MPHTHCRNQRVLSAARIFLVAMLLCGMPNAHAQDFNQIDANGNITQANENRNFNPHDTDSTRSSGKEVPQGMYVWTVDRRFGDIRPTTPDTVPHLYMNSIFNTGLHGEYNSTGNNYTPRQNRIFIDRDEHQQFIFTTPYSFVIRQPDQFHFTNTLSPFTNLTYDNCGDKQNGEDHINAKFAVNAGKRIGAGFDLNYAYARGYFSDQSTSHFGATIYASYLGDQYKAHLLFNNMHQKVAENGGITNDSYITHPEAYSESYGENEIPTVLTRNWNRNDNQHLFFTHRYSLGFYRKVEMTPEEMKARKFAAASKKSNDKKKKKKKEDNSDDEQPQPLGRPDNAQIAGEAPQRQPAATDSTRVKVNGQAMLDSLSAATTAKSEDENMKDDFVPVTSIIHTFELNNYRRIYQAYDVPNNYYADTFYAGGYEIKGDTLYDKNHHLQMKNTVALALLEGFNKYARAGIKAFVSHELRKFQMPDTLNGYSYQQKFSEHNVSIGGQLAKREGKTLHYNLLAETWLVGEDAGQLKLDFDADLNFPLFSDTVQLAAKAYFYRLNPTFFQRHFHSKYIWWDADLSKETRTRIEGMLTYAKTKTSLRFAVEEMQNYTYFGMSYDNTDNTRCKNTACIMQQGSNINLLTAQLRQDLRLGPVNWENIITWQNSSNTDVLPLPTINLWTNLYLKFRIARVLDVELGGDMTYFTSYNAPDYSPLLGQFAVQQNEDSRVELGGYPFIDVYANMRLKRARFFVMMSNLAAGAANKKTFLAPHYPTNSAVLRLGVSWNFIN